MTAVEQIARFFKVLSVPTRVKMLVLLRGRALCVNALARRLHISPAAVSQHLRVLRDLNLVRATKHGYFVHYRLDLTTLTSWKQAASSILWPEESPEQAEVPGTPEDTGGTGAITPGDPRRKEDEPC